MNFENLSAFQPFSLSAFQPFSIWSGVLVFSASLTTKAAQPPHDYPIKPVPFTAVHLTDIFWAPRIETNRVVTIPFAFEQCEKSGRIDNFERAAARLRGE